VLYRFWYLSADDSLREALHDRRLANPGLTDQNGIALGSPCQYLQAPPDFFVPADDGVDGIVVVVAAAAAAAAAAANVLWIAAITSSVRSTV